MSNVPDVSGWPGDDTQREYIGRDTIALTRACFCWAPWGPPGVGAYIGGDYHPITDRFDLDGRVLEYVPYVSTEIISPFFTRA